VNAFFSPEVVGIICNKILAPADISLSNHTIASMNKIWISVLFNTGKKRTQLSILKKMDKSELRQDEMDEPFFLVPTVYKSCYTIE